MKKLFVAAVIVFGCISFVTITSLHDDPVRYPSQQNKGSVMLIQDITILVTGDYVNSGIPFGLYNLGFKKEKANILDRQNENAGVRYDFNVVKASRMGKVLWCPIVFNVMPNFSTVN